LNDRFDEARAIYLENPAARMPGGATVAETISQDFATLRKAGRENAGMRRIESLLGPTTQPTR
jgi:hypothetical protein